MIFPKRIIAVLFALVVTLSLSAGTNAATTDAVTLNGTGYTTVTAAVTEAVAGDTLVLTRDVTEDVTIRKNLNLDLNAHSISGTVTVAEGFTLKIKDSSTDDFTSSDGCGLIKTVGNAQAETGYIAIAERNGTSYHRLDLQISSVNLRPGNAGIYFGSNYGGDEAVKARIKTYGMVMSLAGAPTVQDIISDTAYTTHTAFSGDSWVSGATGSTYGTLLQNIMKPTNTQAQNKANAQRSIYCVSYAELQDGTYALSAPVSISLQEVAQKVDKIWNTLTPSQVTGMKEMFQTYEPIMENWNIPNLLKTDRVQVTFVDFDNSIIDIQTVDIGGNAVKPADPVRKNYAFTGWDKDFTNVVTDLTVKAQYIRQYTVTFVDYNGTVLATKVVNRGGSATPPTSPKREGHTFTGWDTAFTNITANLTVKAKYTANKYTVTFKMPDGTILKHIDRYGKEQNTQTVEYGSFAVAPEVPEYYFYWEKNGVAEYKAYSFTGWSCDISRITADTVAVAVYDSEYNDPILALQYYNNGQLSPSLTLCNLSNAKLYAFNFTIEYKIGTDDSTYGFTVDKVTTNSGASWLFDSKGNPLYDLNINNKTKQLTFAWSSGNGVSFRTYGDFITAITVATTGGAGKEVREHFYIKECSMIISSDDGKTFQKVVPIVIYK